LRPVETADMSPATENSYVHDHVLGRWSGWRTRICSISPPDSAVVSPAETDLLSHAVSTPTTQSRTHPWMTTRSAPCLRRCRRSKSSSAKGPSCAWATKRSRRPKSSARAR
jgi:hypothetical protein